PVQYPIWDDEFLTEPYGWSAKLWQGWAVTTFNLRSALFFLGGLRLSLSHAPRAVIRRCCWCSAAPHSSSTSMTSSIAATFTTTLRYSLANSLSHLSFADTAQGWVAVSLEKGTHQLTVKLT